MKKNLFALALALTLVGSLAACSTDRNPSNNNTGSNAGTNSNTGSGTSGSSAGQVTRRYDSALGGSRSYLDDGRYTAGTNGQVYGGDGNALSRDLTQGARDIVRGTEDMAGSIGQGIGNAARDITGSGNYAGSPSWEPDSSAVRQ